MKKTAHWARSPVFACLKYSNSNFAILDNIENQIFKTLIYSVIYNWFTYIILFEDADLRFYQINYSLSLINLYIKNVLKCNRHYINY